MAGPIIDLERDELIFCAAEGCRRYIDSYLLGGARNRMAGRDADGLGWTRGVLGACGEYAFHLVSGLPLTGWGPGGRGRADVGRSEVRTTDLDVRGSFPGLLVDREGDPEQPWVLVHARPPRFEVVGYVQRSEALEVGTPASERLGGLRRVVVPVPLLHAWDRPRVVGGTEDVRAPLRSSA